MEVPINFSFQTDYRICWGSKSGMIQYHYVIIESACMGVLIQNKIISEKSLRKLQMILFFKNQWSMKPNINRFIKIELHYSGKKPENNYHIKLIYVYMQNIFLFNMFVHSLISH